MSLWSMSHTVPPFHSIQTILPGQTTTIYILCLCNYASCHHSDYFAWTNNLHSKESLEVKKKQNRLGKYLII